MEIDHDKTQQLAEKYDSEIRFRPLDKTATWIVSGLLVALSLFHYYTAGFGLLREATHRGVHLAFVLSLIFLVFGFEVALPAPAQVHLVRPGGVPLYDWAMAIALALSVLYIPYIFEDLAFRVGNPLPVDVLMGSILLVGLLEATAAPWAGRCPSSRWCSWPMPCSGRTSPACSSTRAIPGRRSTTCT